MSTSHWLVFAAGLMLGASITTFVRWSTMPLIIAGLLVTIGALAMMLRAVRR